MPSRKTKSTSPAFGGEKSKDCGTRSMPCDETAPLPVSAMGPKIGRLVHHWTKTRSRAQVAVQKRYARWPMASPNAKYSKSASKMTRAVPIATEAVEPHKTSATTHGIKTAAVATRFQVIERDSPDESLLPSHHIKRNKSRGRNGNLRERYGFCQIGGASKRDFSPRWKRRSCRAIRRPRERAFPFRARPRGFRRNGVRVSGIRQVLRAAARG